MAGNKNSGRPSARQEFARTEKRAEAVNLSWDAVVEFLKSNEFDLKDKMEVASKIAVKTMPSIVGGDKDNPLPLNIVSFADAIKSLSK